MVGNSTFRKLWRQLVPNIVITKPRSDICWECHQNNTAIYRSANLPDAVKGAKLRKQEQHLHTVTNERRLYQQMVSEAKSNVADNKLGRNEPCSRDTAVHYSFDYAQQVHYPSDLLQPGPMYFLCPQKCGIFGVCCEAVPQQVNFLIDEAHACSKGANSMISYLDYFFANVGLGEAVAHLHCDNCSGQNKNKFMIWYLLWRVCTEKHDEITLNFLITGHTKFAPDWCFGLLKQTFRRTPVSCLSDMVSVVNSSTVTGVNIAQLVGKEDGSTVVPCKNWQSFLETSFKTLPNIKAFHYFRFLASERGIVYAKIHADSPEERFDLARSKDLDFSGQPDIISPPGLDSARQTYLFNNIRVFCTDETKDLVCPKPADVSQPVVLPSSSKETTASAKTGTTSAVKQREPAKRKVPVSDVPVQIKSTRSGRKIQQNTEYAD